MSEPKSANKWSLALVALGVVFGDIGTSPLYALRECLLHEPPSAGDELAVLGPISLIVWSLVLMVSIKYLMVITHATNQGEGGMFALLSLLRSAPKAFSPRVTTGFMLVGLMGACLLYGDGMITPAISVLSAVEGLEQLNPDFHRFVVPVACCILLGLFLIQSQGTAKIGVAFGPIMVVWFFTLAGLGLIQIFNHPQVLAALSPHYGVQYIASHGHGSIVIMGLVLLAVTGCEAMYADIGHFGRPPLVKSWFILVMPALLMNYMGQGALILAHPGIVNEPDFHLFFAMVPKNILLPMLILATLSTIIASQAMITGVYSLTQQAVRLGYLPRLKIIHTNPEVRGQIYMPQVNLLLMVSCIALVIGFGSSSNLASAYGLSVSLEMLMTSLIFFFVARKVWSWPLWKALIPVLVFATIESGYVAGSLLKFWDGAWFPLAVALGMWIIMKTWMDGRALLGEATQRGRLPTKFLVEEIKQNRIIRVPGTAVFMSASPEGVPLCLLHHLKHNKALHKNVVLLTVKFSDQPHVNIPRRMDLGELHEGFFRVTLTYGFFETPEVFNDLVFALPDYAKVAPGAISFYQSRELLHATGPGKIAKWRKKLFMVLSRLARPATGFFELPPRQVIELGIQLEL